MTFDPGTEYYAASAQVLPVLLIAVTLQIGLGEYLGEPIRRSLQTLARELDEWMSSSHDERGVDLVELDELKADLASMTRRFLRFQKSARWILTATLLSAVIGEAFALLALALEHPSSILALIVGIAVLLNLSVLMGPLWVRIWGPPVDR